MKLDGKKVLITGGARRIGGELTRSMAAAGAVVYIHCHNGSSQAEQLLSELPGTGHKLFTADFSQPGAAAELAAKCGENARDVVNRFAPDRMIDLWENYIQEIVGKRKC